MSNPDDLAKILTSFLNLNFQTKIFFSLWKVFLHLFQNYSLSTTNNTANQKKKVARVISPNPYWLIPASFHSPIKQNKNSTYDQQKNAQKKLKETDDEWDVKCFSTFLHNAAIKIPLYRIYSFFINLQDIFSTFHYQLIEDIPYILATSSLSSLLSLHNHLDWPAIVVCVQKNAAKKYTIFFLMNCCLPSTS